MTTFYGELEPALREREQLAQELRDGGVIAREDDRPLTRAAARLLEYPVERSPNPCRRCAEHARIRIADGETRCLPCALAWETFADELGTSIPFDWWEDGALPGNSREETFAGEYGMRCDGAAVLFTNKVHQRCWLFIEDHTFPDGRKMKAGDRLFHGEFPNDMWQDLGRWIADYNEQLERRRKRIAEGTGEGPFDYDDWRSLL